MLRFGGIRYFPGILFPGCLVQQHLIFRLRQTPEPRVGRQVDDRRAEDHDLEKNIRLGLESSYLVFIGGWR